MWPERLAIISFFLVITAALTAENLDRAPADRHSWFAVFAPLFVLQALFLLLLLASCTALFRLIVVARMGPGAPSAAATAEYTSAASLHTDESARRRHAASAPDVVWGSIFLVLLTVWTVLLACKLNALDAATAAGNPPASAGGPSWGAIFGLLLAGELLLIVFWFVSALHACTHDATAATAASAAAAYENETSALACAGSLGRCKCAQGLAWCADGGQEAAQGLDVIDGTQEIALYLALVGLVVSTALWLGRVESPDGNDPSLAIVFVPLFVGLGLLFINSVFIVLRASRTGEYCYDWSVTLLYTAGIVLLIIWLALVAGAADEPAGEPAWHLVFLPLYIFLGAAVLAFCSMVVYFAAYDIRRHGAGDKAKWGPLVYDEFAVSLGGTQGVSDQGIDDVAYNAALSPGRIVDRDDAEFDDL